MRVLLVDDHTLVRQALGMMLKQEPDIELAGEAANGSQAVELTRRLQPDVVLMDVNMPVLDGIQATRIIHAEFPGICVIGLSMAERDQQAAAMRDAGAMEYVIKTAAADELLAAIRRCCARLRAALPLDAGA